jgi:hypothetical protein
MWIRRASRGRLPRPLSWKEVRGIVGCVGGAVAAGWEDWVAVGWEGEEEWLPLVWGAASPLTSAMVADLEERYS